MFGGIDGVSEDGSEGWNPDTGFAWMVEYCLLVAMMRFGWWLWWYVVGQKIGVQLIGRWS